MEPVEEDDEDLIPIPKSEDDVLVVDEESLFARDPLGRLIRVDAPTEADLEKSVRVRIDGSGWIEVPKAVPATDAQGNTLFHPDGSTVVRASSILDASREIPPPAGGATRIPLLCHQNHLTPIAVCRVCVVQIVVTNPKDPSAKPRVQRKLLPACQHRAEDGLEVHTMWSPEQQYRKAVRSSVQVLCELLTGDHLHPSRDSSLRHRDQKYHNELADLAKTIRVNWETFPADAVTPREKLDRGRATDSDDPLGSFLAAGGGPRSKSSSSSSSVSMTSMSSMSLGSLGMMSFGSMMLPRFAPKPAEPEKLVGWVDGLPDTANGQKPSREETSKIVSSPPFVVDHNNCILCDRCIRSCSEVKPFKVIGRSGKGPTTQIAFDLRSLPMAESSCRACGECMTACPTGAITFQYRVNDADPTPTTAPGVGADDLLSHPLFGRMPKAFLEWNRGAVRRRDVKAGTVIAEEGEFGATAFILEDGYLAVCRKGAVAPENLPLQKNPNVVKAIQAIPTRYGTPIWVQSPDPGDVIGEMAPLSHARRNATLIALNRARVLEIDRNVLHVMLRDPENRERLDRRYAQRALREFLPRLAVGPGLFGALTKAELDAFIQYVTPSVQLVRATPGYVVCREGEPADNFYLIRLGFVGLTIGGGAVVRAPLKQGDSFGELAVMTRRLIGPTEGLPAHVQRGIRTATCTALDHAELVTIHGPDFETFFGRPDNAGMLWKLRTRGLDLLRRGPK